MSCLPGYPLIGPLIDRGRLPLGHAGLCWPLPLLQLLLEMSVPNDLRPGLCMIVATTALLFQLLLLLGHNELEPVLGALAAAATILMVVLCEIPKGKANLCL